MNDRPIIFSGEMVRSLLAGQKTQTRRILKFPKWAHPDHEIEIDERGIPATVAEVSGCLADLTCPYGEVGDFLWVRETCLAHEFWVREACRAHELTDAERDLCFLDGVIFAADQSFQPIKNTPEAADAWTGLYAYRGKRGARVPPIHMPRWASRLTLKLTEIRVQRLQEISEADAIAEGITGPHYVGYRAFRIPGDSKPRYSRAEAAYEDLWGTINGFDSWEANPYVWALTFEVFKKNIDDYLLGDVLATALATAEVS